MNWWDGDKDTSKAKALRPTIIYYVQSLTQFLLIRLGATTFIQKKGKGPPLGHLSFSAAATRFCQFRGRTAAVSSP